MARAAGIINILYEIGTRSSFHFIIVIYLIEPDELAARIENYLSHSYIVVQALEVIWVWSMDFDCTAMNRLQTYVKYSQRRNLLNLKCSAV